MTNDKYKFTAENFKAIRRALIRSARHSNPADRNEIIVRLLCFRGLQAAEICSLSWSDVGRLSYCSRGNTPQFEPFSKIRINSDSYLKWNKKQQKRLGLVEHKKRDKTEWKLREIKVGVPFKDILLEFHTNIAEESELELKQVQDQPLVSSYNPILKSDEFYPLVPKTISDIFKDIASQTEYRDFTARDARKFAIRQQMRRRGLDKSKSLDMTKVREVSDYFGFADDRAVLKICNE